MAGISYITILNSIVSTEGSGGFMTNYIYYSLLVVYGDGSRSVVSVKDSQMGTYLPFIRTPIDELQDLRAQVNELKSTVKSLRKDISDITNQNMNYVVESLFPIPETKGLTEQAALQALKEAGLSADITRDYREGLPRSGVVYAFKRNMELFKVVDLELVYPLPDLTGLKGAEARALLESEDFRVELVEEATLEEENDKIQRCVREEERNQNVVLYVWRRIPAVVGLDRAEAERILREAGFEPTVKRVITDDVEANRILSCNPDPENKMTVLVEYAASRNDMPIKGMTEPEALSYLKDNGVPFEVIYRYDEHAKGSVYDFRWSGLEGDNQQLAVFVSKGLEIMNSSNIKVKNQNMQGSNGDIYSASASYNQTTKELVLQLDFTVNPKARHKLTEARPGTDSKTKLTGLKVVSSTAMEPGVNGNAKLTANVASIPEDISLKLVTQYGLMNKTEDIALNLIISW